MGKTTRNATGSNLENPGNQAAQRTSRRSRRVAPEFATLTDVRLGSTQVAIIEPNDAGYALIGRRVPEDEAAVDSCIAMALVGARLGTQAGL